MKNLTYPAAAAPRTRTPEQWASHHRRVVAVLIALGLLCSYPAGVFLMAVLAAPLHHPSAPALRPIKGAGVVVSMNDATGAVAVQHAGVPELNLPAGTTAFRASAEVLRRTQVGDHISFDLTPEDGIYTITGTQPADQ